MRLKEIPHGLELGKAAEGYVRTPGLHASDLYGRYYKDNDPKRYDKRDAEGEPTKMDMQKIELGLCFEQELELLLEATARRMAGRLMGERPGEFDAPHEADCPTPEMVVGLAGDVRIVCGCGAGTAYSPDYLFDIDGELVLGEFKCSWYSTRDAPQDKKFAKWWTQIKLYCHWLGIRKARLFVFFVNGDYKPPTPQLRCWEATFTQQDLRDEVNEVVRHAQKKGLLKAA